MDYKYNLIKIDDMNFSVRTFIRLKCAKINSFQELLIRYLLETAPLSFLAHFPFLCYLPFIILPFSFSQSSTKTRISATTS